VRKKPKAVIHRDKWPRIREMTIKGKILYQVDPRPHSKREHFTLLTKARTRADQVARDRSEHGIHAVHMPMKERLELLEAKEKLKSHQKSISEAVNHYVAYLDRQKALDAALNMPEGLDQWQKHYEGRNRSPRTIGEIRNMATIFRTAFGQLRIPEMNPSDVKTFLDDFRLSLKVTEDITVFRFPNIPRYGARAGQLNAHFLDVELFVSQFLGPLVPYYIYVNNRFEGSAPWTLVAALEAANIGGSRS
jgi:hypothetical protein